MSSPAAPVRAVRPPLATHTVTFWNSTLKPPYLRKTMPTPRAVNDAARSLMKMTPEQRALEVLHLAHYWPVLLMEAIYEEKLLEKQNTKKEAKATAKAKAKAKVAAKAKAKAKPKAKAPAAKKRRAPAAEPVDPNDVVEEEALAPPLEVKHPEEPLAAAAEIN